MPLSVYLRLTLAMGLLWPAFSFGQCVPDSLVPSVPGIYPRILPDATGCEPYSLDVTFFLPRDTTVTFFGQTVTLPFNYFRIDSVAGLPDGMTWACNNQPDCLYDVAPGNPSPDTLGCIHLSGTPTVAAAYVIVVYITAHLDLTGESQGTYLAPLRVRPCVFTGDCYSYTLESPCEPSILKTDNLIPSQGNPGYSYRWTFSGPAGPFYTTSDEQPLDLPLPAAGSYIIDYQARIDTADWILEDARIEAIGCADVFDGADLYWRLKDANDSTWFSTQPTPATNAGATLPLLTNLPDQNLPDGLYRFEVFDKENIGNDEPCGPSGNSAVYFVVPPPFDTLTVTNGPLTVTLFFNHPISQIQCRDTFTVEALPAEPLLTALEDTFTLCEGDSLHLVVTGADSVQWFKNGKLLPAASGNAYVTGEAGFYHVESISTTSFCRQRSAEIEITVLRVDPPAILLDAGQVFRIVQPKIGVTYRWYEVQTGLAGTGVTFTPPSAGNYFARAFDPAVNCESGPSATVGMVPTSIPGDPGILSVRVDPNPMEQDIRIRWETDYSGPVTASLSDLTGRVVWKNGTRQVSGLNEWDISLPELPGGPYFLTFETARGVFTQLLIRQ